MVTAAAGSITKTDDEVVIVVSSQSQTLRVPPRVRTTIRSIKEILKNHSDAEIYAALKESNMDPNETAQKLLNQDPFHEVKRKRDKRKENVMQVSAYRRNHSQNVSRTVKDSVPVVYNGQRGGYARNMFPRNPGYARKSLSSKASLSREFRVVKDNRLNYDEKAEVKSPSKQYQVSPNEKGSLHAADTGLMVGSVNDKSSGGRSSFQASVGISNLHNQQLSSSSSVNPDKDKDSVGVLGAMSPKPTTRPHSASSASSSSVVRLYSSSTDPVHSPSPDRFNSAVGAIKREVGVVGGRRHPNDSKSGVSTSNSPLRRDHSSSESCPPSSSVFRSDKLNQTTATPSFVSMNSGSRFLSNQNGSKKNQHVAGHQKASQPVKEWKPKSSKNSPVSNPGTICAPLCSITSQENDFNDVSSEADKLEEKLSQIHFKESCNVIIAEHIRVSDADRAQLTFGSLGSGCYRSAFAKEIIQEQNEESATSLSIPAASSDGNNSSNKQVDMMEEQPRNSQADSPASLTIVEHHFIEKKESVPQISNNHGDAALVQNDIRSVDPSEMQQQHDSELPNFLAYDPQTGSELPYCRTPMEEAVVNQVLPSPQEALSSHVTNSVPASSMAIGGQQQPMAQMYPQFHVSHFANLMPYRQFVSPVYVPPMGVPGYSSNPAYPHPSNGNNFVLMGGGNTHLNAGLKYGVQPFKAIHASSAAAFGNFPSPAGCAVNPPGVVGNAPGLDDSSWSKFKDNNLYVSNPQAESSEMWMSNPRELSGMQSSPYYNMTGQTPHAAYLPSHTGHASVNPAATQSSHMQFPGLYHHPPQHAATANPHHLGTAMSGNVGVGVAAPSNVAQVGTYQQPQLSHLNWKLSF